MTKLKWRDLSVRDQIPVPSLPFPQRFTEWIMCPLCWSDQLFTLLPPWKKENYVFATDLAKLISLPSSGSEAAVSKSAISLCFVPVSAGEILNSLCTILFKFCIILKLCFFEVGAHQPPRLAVRARCSLGWQCADLFPCLMPVFSEVSVRSVRCASCSLLA